MPYPNEHSARLRAPDDFNPDTFRRVADGKLYGRIKVPATVAVIWGKLKSADKPSDYPIAQSLRFPTKDWTEAEARAWLADNAVKHAAFEAAAKDDDGQARAGASLEFRAPGPLTIAAAAGAKKLPRFEIVAYTGGELLLPDWPAPVVVELAGMDLPAELPILADHDPGDPVGHGTAELIDGKLIVAGVVSIDSDKSRAFVLSSRNGFPWAASIGAQPLARRLYHAGETFTANGRSFTAGEDALYLVSKSRLKEVSVLSLAADPNTEVRIAASRRGLEKDMPDKTDAQKRADERARLELIEAACAGIRPENCLDLKGQALREEISLQELQAGLLTAAKQQGELDEIRAARPGAPAIHGELDGRRPALQVIEAAAVLTAVVGDFAEKQYDEPTLEAADKLRGLGIQELVASAAALEGVSLPKFRNEPQAWLRGAFSTLSVPNILSNVAGKVLVASFSAVEQTWQVIAKRSSVKDFKASPRYRLTGDMKYVQVAPTGELQHAALGEEGWTLQADTYGRIIGLPRQMLVNDDLGAFAEIPAALGRGAGLSLNEIFWTAFLDNAAFFKTANNNYADGADTALAIAGLTAAELMFLDQVDKDGHPIAIPPAILLTPTDLNAVASELMTALEVRGPATGSKVPVVNPHAKKFRPVSSTYLKNSSFPGFSVKAWYLTADPNVLPCIEIAFLDGKETPTVETAQANFNTLGIEMRGYHDFAVSLADHRGGVKMKGEL